MPNPFSARPATANSFHGRIRELEILVQRSLGNGESTIIVSEFPNGKGSLIRELHQRLDKVCGRLAFIDAEGLPHSCTPDDFWAEILFQFGASRRGKRSYRDLETLLLADESGRHSVLLVDGVQALVHLPAFACPDLWGRLRAFTQSQGLVLIGTSNLDLVALTEKTRTLTLGSPFFNAMRELILGPLDPDAADSLLRRGEDRLSSDDQRWIQERAGGSPKLLHMLGSLLWDAAGDPHVDCMVLRENALTACRREMRHIFATIWSLFPWEERWVLLRVALAQRCGLDFSHATEEASPRAAAPATNETIATNAESALVRILERRLTRPELKRLLRSISGVPPELLLPGDCVVEMEFFAAAAGVLIRHGLVRRFLDCLLQWVPASAEDVAEVAELWPCSTRRTAKQWRPASVHTQRLAARGLLERTLRSAGWLVAPPIFYWWLLDQIQLLASGTELGHWMATQHLDGAIRLPLAEAKLFMHEVDRHAELLLGPLDVLSVEARS